MSDFVNTSAEEFDTDTGNSTEDILMNENELLQGLIEAGNERNNAEFFEKIQIRRAGKLYFEFRIRPLSDSEYMMCRDKGTKYAPRKRNQPKIEIDTDVAEMRSWLIYTATIDEDREKLWNNKKAQDAFNVLTGPEVIDKALLMGEKSAIIDRIDEISGFNTDYNEIAKN